MPDDNLLAQFHNLGDADVKVRCAAAQGVRDTLLSSEVAKTELAYTLRRLVRGVQSSRQCCRQGFSLALAEVLHAFPQELQTVLQLLEQTSELQAGLRSGEQKERLLGKLLVYVAILQAGSLKGAKGKGLLLAKEQLEKLGSGLAQIYSARSSLSAAAARAVSDACSDLCQGGHFASVPEVLSAWSLDKKINGAEDPDVNAYGIFFTLHLAYKDALKAGIDASTLKSWPACVRKDASNTDAIVNMARCLGKALAATPLAEAAPSSLDSFCRWWLREAKGKDAQAIQPKIWKALEEGLFQEEASLTMTAQAFRGLGEIGLSLQTACSENSGQVELILPGLFEQLETGFGLLFKALAWVKSPAHPAALFAQAQLLATVTGQQGQQQHPSQQSAKRKKGQQEPSPTSRAPTEPAPGARISDEARLAILSALQRHKDWNRLPGNFQRQWQQALLSHLAAPGLRSRCAELLAGLASVPSDGEESAVLTVRTASQLEQLAMHVRAPDDVILSVICMLFTSSYFGHEGAAATRYSLRDFKASVGLPAAPPGSGDDFLIPTLPAEVARSTWSTKLWSTLGSLVRRTLPEAAEKLVPGAEEEAVNSGAESTAGEFVRTLAFQGCLSDGSLLILRLHDWWDHVLANASATPKPSPKKKKRSDSGGGIKCIVEVEEAHLDLRRRALESCRSIMSISEGLSSRQKNAICGLPLCLSLMLLAADADEAQAAAEPLSDVLEILVELPKVVSKGGKIKKKLQESLASLPTVAAELFVSDTGSFVREAAKATWRELGMFLSDETLTSLCASVKGDETNDTDAKDGESEDDDEEDSDDVEDTGPRTPQQAARIAAFEQATKEGKARQAAEKQSGVKKPKGDDEDEEDITTLDDAGMLAQLLDDDDGGELLESFASSGLEGAKAPAKKLTKRQQQLRRKQEEINRKFREVELLEIFLARYGERRSTSSTLMKDLFDAMMKASSNAKADKASQEETEDGKGNDGKQKKQSKGDAALRRLEGGLSQRLSKLLQKALRQLCRGSNVDAVAGWHSAEEWAAKARALCLQGQGQKMATSGAKSLEVGSLMLYFFCAGHRAATVGQDSSKSSSGADSWPIAEELLTSLLQEWGGKKDCDQWCQAALKAFTARAPQLLRRLPWMESIRACRKAFAQRAQLTFVATELLRPAPPGSGQVAPPAAFVEGFAGLCAELLEATLSEASEGSDRGGAGATTPNQKQKLRREALLGLKCVIKLQQKGTQLPATIAADLARAVAGVRDSMPSQQRRGEAYQLCLHVLRIVRPQVAGDRSERQGSSSPSRPAKKQKQTVSSSGQASSGSSVKDKRKKGRSSSRSPSQKPAASPALRAARS
eukprot:TRINITY_DN15038_c0_g1_i1.p1 TRINITY_DN15038_c0_g1~~TRINITY_DN15038_c0_g1_i1.p1  ORF type:complete len:1347 (+),score=340.32 TRINITY_DN15038_c0_g1_i1:72-4112(+)